MKSETYLLFQRGVRRGLLTLLREKQWLTALGALFGIFLLGQILLMSLIGITGVHTLLREQTDLRLEIQEDAEDYQIQQFFTTLQQQPFVEEALYIPKEKTYEQTRKTDPQLIAFLEEFQFENPFTDTVAVTLQSFDDYPEFSTFIQDEQWQDTVDPAFLSEVSGQEQRVQSLLRLTNAGWSLVLLMLGLSTVALLFVIMELIRRRSLARSDEVLVERLVGASTYSVVLPFATEATLLLIGSTLMSSIVLYIIIVVLPFIIPELSGNGALAPLSTTTTPLLWSYLPLFLLVEMLLMPVIGSIGAWLGIRPQALSPHISIEH